MRDGRVGTQGGGARDLRERDRGARPMDNREQQGRGGGNQGDYRDRAQGSNGNGNGNGRDGRDDDRYNRDRNYDPRAGGGGGDPRYESRDMGANAGRYADSNRHRLGLGLGKALMGCIIYMG